MKKSQQAAEYIVIFFLLLIIAVVVITSRRVDEDIIIKNQSCMLYVETNETSFKLTSTDNENCRTMLDSCVRLNGTIYNLTSGKMDTNKYVINECYIGPSMEELENKSRLSTLDRLNASCQLVGNKLIISNFTEKEGVVRINCVVN